MLLAPCMLGVLLSYLYFSCFIFRASPHPGGGRPLCQSLLAKRVVCYARLRAARARKRDSARSVVFSFATSYYHSFSCKELSYIFACMVKQPLSTIFVFFVSK